MDENLYFANFYNIYPPLAIHGWKATDLSFNLAPRYRDLKDPTSRQNFDDTPGQIPKLILTLRPMLSLILSLSMSVLFLRLIIIIYWSGSPDFLLNNEFAASFRFFSAEKLGQQFTNEGT